MNLRRNGLFNAAEVIVNGLCLFLIYRNVVEVLGVSMLGVWSLVLATSAFGRAADLGISGGLARFIARALGEGRPVRALAYLRTGLVFIAVTMAVVALALWWPLSQWLGLALDGVELDAARGVLPWAILNFWLLMVKAVLDASLTGVHRADLKAVAGIAGMLIQLVLSYMLVRDHELFGLAWAQAAQFVVALTMEGFFLHTVARISVSGSLPWFSRSIMKEMFGFGVKLQLGSLANLMFEPAVKSVIAAMAGTPVLGIFEMAYRMSYQVRNVATMALQPTVAAFASLSQESESKTLSLFRSVTRTAALAAAVLMAGVAVGSPLVSWLYLGRVDPLFVYISGLMGIMWGATILASPAYYYGIASGRVMPYVIGEFLAVGVACTAVLLLGPSGSAPAMVAGASLGKLLSSMLLGTLTRPTEEWRGAVILNRDTWASFAVLIVVCGGAIALALPELL